MKTQQIVSAKAEHRDHLIEKFGSAKAAAEYADRHGFESVAELASETGYESELGRQTRIAYEAAFARSEVNGVQYRSEAEAGAVRKILRDAGCEYDHPSSPRAKRALSDAGRNGTYHDAIEGNVVDMGSLDPLDIGFDLRVTRTPIDVPDAPAGHVVRVVTPRSEQHARGEVLYASPAAIRAALSSRGFVVA